jgi:DNA-binding MarR family transcriptional regulator
MNAAAERSARDVLETVPTVMRFIRAQVRRRRAARLSLYQFRALFFLNRAKDCSLSVAADHLGLSLPAMSRLIHGLVVGGLVERRAVLTNRRQVALALTAAGRSTLQRVHEDIRRRLADSLRALSAGEHKTVQRAMRLLQNVFGAQNPALAAERKAKT